MWSEVWIVVACSIAVCQPCWPMASRLNYCLEERGREKKEILFKSTQWEVGFLSFFLVLVDHFEKRIERCIFRMSSGSVKWMVNWRRPSNTEALLLLLCVRWKQMLYHTHNSFNPLIEFVRCLPFSFCVFHHPLPYQWHHHHSIIHNIYRVYFSVKLFDRIHIYTETGVACHLKNIIWMKIGIYS